MYVTCTSALDMYRKVLILQKRVNTQILNTDRLHTVNVQGKYIIIMGSSSNRHM